MDRPEKAAKKEESEEKLCEKRQRGNSDLRGGGRTYKEKKENQALGTSIGRKKAAAWRESAA